MPTKEQEEMVRKYISPIPNELRSIRELADGALYAYDKIEAEDRFPIIHLLEQIGDGYIIRLVVPLIGDIHPAHLIMHAAKLFQHEGVPQADAAMVLLDTWGYPQDVLDLIAASDSADVKNGIDRMWEHLPPSRHPNRINLSVCQIAFRDGHNESVQQTRGDESSRSWLDDRDESSKMMGRIPDAVRTLVD